MAGQAGVASAQHPHYERGVVTSAWAQWAAESAPSWMDEAACSGHQPIEDFFPSAGQSIDVAVAICSSCPVQESCLEYALTNHEHHGIWGGKSERERRRIRRRRARQRVFLR